VTIERAGIAIHTAVVSRFRLDGGAMFGVVPRPLWSRVASPDPLGRIELVARIGVAIFGSTGRIAVIDSGMGSAWSRPEAERYGLEPEGPGLAEALGALGISTSEVTDAIMTHLHFDHAGGWFRAGPSGRPEPVLSKARHHVQRAHWEWARAPSPRDRASFLAPCLDALESRGLVNLLDGEIDLFDGLRLLVLEGHTVGLQLPLLRGREGAVFFPSDLIPTAAHGRAAWIMAYDLRPLDTLREKALLMDRARREGWVLVLGHDPVVSAARVVNRDGSLTLDPCACPARI
jgi:glyoxylase-like metal-dependent hydrolase (beta-lactamase superfamily II)